MLQLEYEWGLKLLFLYNSISLKRQTFNCSMRAIESQLFALPRMLKSSLKWTKFWILKLI